jgi:hypothetical protein
MKRAMALGVFAAIVFVFLTAGTKLTIPSQTTASSELPSITLRITPTQPSPYELLGPKRGPQRPTTYDASVYFGRQEGAKNGYLGIVSVQIEPGMRATRTATFGEYEVTLTAGVDRERNHAKAEVMLMRNGVRVQEQESDVLLRPVLPDRNIPLQ